MTVKRAIIDAPEEIDEISKIINTHDETGDADADMVIKRLCVAAALAYNKAKVNVAKVQTSEDEFMQAIAAVMGMIQKWFTDPETYDIVKTACLQFVANITDLLIIGVQQQYTPTFSQINEDLSLTFLFLEGDADVSNPDGVSAST